MTSHKLFFILLVICVSVTLTVPNVVAQTPTSTVTSTNTPTPTSMPTNTPTPTSTPMPTPTPTPRHGVPYIFRGYILHHMDSDIPLPEFDVHVTCDGAPTVVVRSHQKGDGRQEWEFDESVHLGSGVLPGRTTCDIELELPTGAGYRGVSAWVWSSAPSTVVGATHVRYTGIIPATYTGIEFKVAKPIAVHDTAHFSIEWITYSNDPEYPDGGKQGLDYVQLLGESLEQAWNKYEDLGYTMPLPTPDRSDDRISVYVQQPFEVCGVLSIRSTGFAVMGQIWIQNNLNTDGEFDSYLSHVAAHELFHLVQQVS